MGQLSTWLGGTGLLRIPQGCARPEMSHHQHFQGLEEQLMVGSFQSGWWSADWMRSLLRGKDHAPAFSAVQSLVHAPVFSAVQSLAGAWGIAIAQCPTGELVDR